MKAVAEAVAALGEPVFMKAVGNDPSPSAMIARWRHGSAELDFTPSDTVMVSISLQGGQQARHQTGNAPSHASVRVGSVSVLPAHQRTQIAVQGEADILQIFLREPFLDAAVDGQFACLALFNSHDSELRAAAMQLFVAATRGDRDDSLLLETGVHRMAAGLLNHRESPTPRPARGGLGSAACRRVDDLITGALQDTAAPTPTLGQLATAASLSVNHFIRAFRQQTGVTPHRHIVLRRLERGLALLKRPGVSVAEVADDAGFATPAHFVATFRRTMGVTPGALREALQH
jgi:AraC family transcriptional regulator